MSRDHLQMIQGLCPGSYPPHAASAPSSERLSEKRLGGAQPLQMIFDNPAVYEPSHPLVADEDATVTLLLLIRLCCQAQQGFHMCRKVGSRSRQGVPKDRPDLSRGLNDAKLVAAGASCS